MTTTINGYIMEVNIIEVFLGDGSWTEICCY